MSSPSSLPRVGGRGRNRPPAQSSDDHFLKDFWLSPQCCLTKSTPLPDITGFCVRYGFVLADLAGASSEDKRESLYALLVQHGWPEGYDSYMLASSRGGPAPPTSGITVDRSLLSPAPGMPTAAGGRQEAMLEKIERSLANLDTIDRLDHSLTALRSAVHTQTATFSHAFANSTPVQRAARLERFFFARAAVRLEVARGRLSPAPSLGSHRASRPRGAPRSGRRAAAAAPPTKTTTATLASTGEGGPRPVGPPRRGLARPSPTRGRGRRRARAGGAPTAASRRARARSSASSRATSTPSTTRCAGCRGRSRRSSRR